jgi:hypothetical protein
MSKNKKRVEAFLHGECFIFPSAIPATAKPRQSDRRDFMIVAESETTGNHHVVDLLDGVEFFEDEQKLYMKNSVPTKVRCTTLERHDEIVLEPNTWEFGIAKEYDHIAEELQKVRD